MSLSRSFVYLIGAALAMNVGQAPSPAESKNDKDSAKARPSVPARRGDVVDDYHGVKVADPYRWLEDPDSPETRAWVEAENAATFAYLAEIPARADLKARLTKLWDYEKFGVPFHEGDRYFY